MEFEEVRKQALVKSIHAKFMQMKWWTISQAGDHLR